MTQYLKAECLTVLGPRAALKEEVFGRKKQEAQRNPQK